MKCLHCDRPRRKSGRGPFCSVHAVQHWVHRAPQGDEILDEFAIEWAMAGRRVELTAAERTEAVRRLTERGHSARDIGIRLYISERHVVRYRSRIRWMAEAV